MNTRQRILIIDDDDDQCTLLSEIAVTAGLAPMVSTDPAQLLRLAEQDPAIIVLDLIMPNIDGVEILRQLAQLKCKARIILVSGCDRQLLNVVGKLASALKLNLAGQISKPIDVDAMEALFQSSAQAAT
ncbi:response regulator [Methylogaea oryzae]|uniref:Response regulator n=1 Tax=Methylogaea oryzae TaxID=1295382 RepID=A0A8D4VRE5_9GAMM|nr:response regulator [Methylogaea oryzae]BBL72678.1 response regulator [Methylogaea oryzae]